MDGMVWVLVLLCIHYFADAYAYYSIGTGNDGVFLLGRYYYSVLLFCKLVKYGVAVISTW